MPLFHRVGNMEKQDALAALAALSQETRLDVFRLLIRAGSEGLAAGSIGRELGIPAATLSFHLKELKNAAIVRCAREGTYLIYAPDCGAMAELIRFLTHNCCQGVELTELAPQPGNTD